MPSQSALQDQTILISSLIRAFRRSGLNPRCFETHISWVIVAGEFAYKLKKAEKFDFLDFSSLCARRFYCEEELRLNRRFAPDIYLYTSFITGSLSDPEIDGKGAAIEYAVKMRAFPQDALWTHRIESGLLSDAEVDQLAFKLAAFHLQAAHAPPGKPWGSASFIEQIDRDSLTLIADRLHSERDKEQMRALMGWENRVHAQLRPVFEERKSEGYVRECHGDLHCGNLLTLDGHPIAFDCIEFNESFRWIDVLNDLAFTAMDLWFHGLHEKAARLINQYLEETGDYGHLAVLRYYETSRALVRCKVALLQASEPANGKTSASCLRKAHAYLAFSLQNIQPVKPHIMITHGLSGSGKSTLARVLVQVLGAVRIRSDVERKRLHGLSAKDDGTALATTLYSVNATKLTYERLEKLALLIFEAGLSVVVDAAFLRQEERERFAKLARRLNASFHIFDLCTDEDTMRSRLLARKRQGGDPSDADASVLDRQLAFHEGLTSAEMKYVIQIDGGICADREKIADIIEKRLWEPKK